MIKILTENNVRTSLSSNPTDENVLGEKATYDLIKKYGISIPELELQIRTDPGHECIYVSSPIIHNDLFLSLNPRIILVRRKKTGKCLKAHGGKSRRWKWVNPKDESNQKQLLNNNRNFVFDFPTNISKRTKLKRNSQVVKSADIVNAFLEVVGTNMYQCTFKNSTLINTSESVLDGFNVHATFGFCIRIDNPLFNYDPQYDEVEFYDYRYKHLYGPVTPVRLGIVKTVRKGSATVAKYITIK